MSESDIMNTVVMSVNTPHWLSNDEIDMLGQPLHQETNDPVTQYNSGWYWWDETWAGCFGPYGSQEEARVSVKKYSETL